MGFDIMLETVTSAGFMFFSSNFIRSALVKMPIYSSDCFMSNASAPCDDILLADSSTLAEGWIESGGCMSSEIYLSDIFYIAARLC